MANPRTRKVFNRKIFNSSHFALRPRWKKLQLLADLERARENEHSEIALRNVALLQDRLKKMEKEELEDTQMKKEKLAIKPYTEFEKRKFEAENMIDPMRIPKRKELTWGFDMKKEWDLYEEEMRKKYDYMLDGQELLEERVWKANYLMENSVEMTYRRAISLLNDAIEKQFVPSEKSGKYTRALAVLLERYREIVDEKNNNDDAYWIEQLQKLEAKEPQKFREERNEERNLQKEINEMRNSSLSEEELEKEEKLRADGKNKSKAHKIDLEGQSLDAYKGSKVTSPKEQVLQKRQELASKALRRFHQSKVGKLILHEAHLHMKLRTLDPKAKIEQREKIKEIQQLMNVKDIRMLQSLYATLNRIVDSTIKAQESYQDNSPEALQEEANLIIDRVSQIVRLFFEYDARFTDIRTALYAYEILRDSSVDTEIKRRSGELLTYAQKEFEFMSSIHTAERDIL